MSRNARAQPRSPRGDAGSRVTLGEWVGDAARRLTAARVAFGHGTRNAGEEASWIIAHVLALPFARLPGSAARLLTAGEQRTLSRLLEKRIASRQPLAYLLGEAWLRGRRFCVDRRVIVPRSFISEILPDGISPWLQPGAVRRVLDLCTGSCCLAILAAYAYPAASVTASDISRRALAVAKRNRGLHRMNGRIRLVQGDLRKGLPAGRFDLVVANPPYVNERSMRRLPAEYRSEPRLALAGGAGGLDFAAAILEQVRDSLSPRGVLVMEIGNNRAALERRYPGLDCVWLATSGGEDMVMLVTREALVTAGFD